MCHLVPKPQHHKDDKVFKERKEDEDDADEDPLNERTDLAGGRNFLRCAVVQVDRHQEESEEKSEPSGDGVHTDSEADPADHDHKTAGDEVGVDVHRRLSLQDHLET